MKHIPTLFLMLVITTMLAACGFQLQPEAELPAQMERTQLLAQDPYSHFVRRLTILLEQNGAHVVDKPPSGAVLEIPENKVRKV